MYSKAVQLYIYIYSYSSDSFPIYISAGYLVKFLCYPVGPFGLSIREGTGTPLQGGKSRGRRSLVVCRPWGREESDMTERLHFHFSLLCIGEGNGNPLRCSCLENPRDGVAQSQT